MAPPLTKKDDDRDDEDSLYLGQESCDYDITGHKCSGREAWSADLHIICYCSMILLGMLCRGIWSLLGCERWSWQSFRIFYRGWIQGLNATVNRRKDEDDLTSGLTHHNFIKCIQSQRFKFRGVNFSGIDLSKLLMNLPCYFRNVLSCHQLSYTEVPTSPKQC